jgi:predicted acylesterase/phospholipase RssA
VLSGGGMNGAYTAGVLKGWTASGNRPPFDVVTGISTGALIAPLALLGSEYDGTLETTYTSVRDHDIYARRPVVALLWSDSVASSAPLRHLIERQATPEIIAKVAQSHLAGRRLYVGTTNLDTKRLVVWDLGAIAAGRSPQKVELFRRILLASCSVPGIFPPVPIEVEVDGNRYTEFHVDGGVAASVFLHPSMLQVDPTRNASAACGANVYVIVAGKLSPEATPVKHQLLQVSAESLGGMAYARMEGDLLRLFVLTRYAGATFHLAAVPQHQPLPANILSFDPPTMQRLFDTGYRAALLDRVWAACPPEVEAVAEAAPRGGVRFVVVRQEAPSWPSTATDSPPAIAD